MPPRKKIEEAPIYTPMPNNTSLMHPHWEEMGRKIFMTLLGILIAYAIVYMGALIRNELREYQTIGYADKTERTITLDAQGKATVTPDVAMTTIGMVAQAASVAEAQEQNTAVMNTLIERLKGLGISDADIQTSNYAIYPTYNYTEVDGRVQEGYEVSQSVTVKIRDLDRANEVLALAGEVGANTVSGLRFTIDDTEVYKAAARKDALEQIDAKVQELERMLGVDVVSVVTYSEYQGGGYGPVMYERAYATDESGAATPTIEEGTEEVLLNVAITFEIR